jgi:threonine dehydrogenase-like Zn-dependent dehydrogenase
VFGITTHETFELDGGHTHFLEGRMDASFGTTPLAMSKAIRLAGSGLVDVERVISHRFPLSQINEAVEVMGTPERNKVIIQPWESCLVYESNRQHRSKSFGDVGLANA